MEGKSVLELFHPAVGDWFTKNIGVPSPPQEQGWPVINRNENVLISAPTGAGKTLSAFLVCINWLLERGLSGSLDDRTYVLYISPLKALNNDIYRNLELPLAGIANSCAGMNIAFPSITRAVRTGDTTAKERQKMLRKPPHILITTPESLYLLLTSKKSRELLRSIRYVIVDEIHALLNNKRGAHLTLSIERLRHLTGRDFVRIGLSATVNPMEEAARFLGGCVKSSDAYVYRPVRIVAPKLEKKTDLLVTVPVHSYKVLEEGSVWPAIYEEIYRLVLDHKSTLVFVNNRTTAEKIAANLNFMALRQIAATHHGSISRESRLEIENKLKSGELPCLVATSSLELGIDIGDIDLIIQVSSPKSAARGLQRLGRAGHRLNAVSKGRIIPKTRGDLLDCVVISREMMNREIEEEKMPKNALDIVSQHLVSMACSEDWKLDDIMDLLRQAYPFNTIKTDEVIKVLNMLAGEYEHREDVPRSPRVYWDSVNQVMMGNGYSRMLAVGGSTIPDRGYFGVYLEDKVTRLGELDEEFVFEARVNDRFLLGTSAWRIVKIERDRVLVSPAGYSGASVPFWKGEGLGRPYDTGLKFGEFIRELDARAGRFGFIPWLMGNAPITEDAARNLEEYILEQRDALGAMSSDMLIIVECFGDETGDTRMVVHSHFGSRVNSGLAIMLEHALKNALNCEIEMNYTDDGILIHLIGLNAHPRNIFSLIDSKHTEEILIDELPLTQIYSMTFRYNAARALMMGTSSHGRRNPLWIQRLRGLEALKLAQKYTDHPLVIETFRECLEHIMDVPSIIRVLSDIESHKIEVVERFTAKPSPFTSELLFNFAGIAMYDPQSAKTKEPDQKIVSNTDALNLNYRLEGKGLVSDTAAEEAAAFTNPLLRGKGIRSANELHGILLAYGDLYTGGDDFASLEDEYRKKLEEWFNELSAAGRAAEIRMAGGNAGDSALWIAAEERRLYDAAFRPGCTNTLRKPKSTDAKFVHANSSDAESGINTESEEAKKRIIRRFAKFYSPFDEDDIIRRYGLDMEETLRILEELERNGVLVYGSFRLGHGDEWYHYEALNNLRQSSMRLERESVQAGDAPALARFLCAYQKVGKVWASPADGLLEAIIQLKGLYLPIQWWESIIFPARVQGYKPSMLDALCSSGKVFWRIRSSGNQNESRLAFYTMEDISSAAETDYSPGDLSPEEASVLSVLRRRGACFLHSIAADPSVNSGSLLQTMEGLFWKGCVVNDSFEAVRYFMSGMSDNVKRRAQKRAIAYRMEMGRWEIPQPVEQPGLERLLEMYLNRWGVISKETYNMEDPPVPWASAYEMLKQWEYIGKVKHGYFFTGLSGIQFMLPHLLPLPPSLSSEFTVLAGCDTAQPYGRLCPFPQGADWSNLPSTAVVLQGGVPVLSAERWGERINTYDNVSDTYGKAISVLAEAFHKKAVWSGRRKITIKQWNGSSLPAEGSVTDCLKNAGFEREMQDMVLWRRIH